MSADKPSTWYEVRDAAGALLYRDKDWETARDDYLERLDRGETVELLRVSRLCLPTPDDFEPLH